jgi:hypothetical protein
MLINAAGGSFPGLLIEEILKSRFQPKFTFYCNEAGGVIPLK